MDFFDDIDDVKDWLEPLDYVAFWDAVAPYGIFPEADRIHCDRIIADAIVPEDTVLYGLKAMARMALTDRFDLDYRIYEPVDAQYLASTH